MCLFHIACAPICSFERFALAALLLRFSCSFNDLVHHGFLWIQLFSVINTNINQYKSILKCHICHYGSHHHLTKTVAFVMVCCLALLCVLFSIILLFVFFVSKRLCAHRPCSHHYPYYHCHISHYRTKCVTVGRGLNPGVVSEDQLEGRWPFYLQVVMRKKMMMIDNDTDINDWGW